MAFTVRASVDPRLLTKADRLFRNDDPGVWIELLQNARRAGATLIEVTLNEIPAQSGQCTITVQDNGRGIDDFQTLLALGQSGWSADLQSTEDPAGMGFFSLCHSEVEVHSGRQRMTITPEIFLGQGEAQIETTNNSIAGTKIRFTRESTRRALAQALARVSEFCPVEVRLDGDVLPRHDFLEGALHREVIDGIEVGFATQFKWGDNDRDLNWNFYGSRIRQPFDDFRGILDPAALGAPVPLHARFNVLETGRVSLQLPDRRAIIQNRFFTEFLQKVRTAAYRFFQKQGQHLLPFKNWQEARQLGVALPEAVCVLAPWFADPQDENLDPLFGRNPKELLPDVSHVILLDRDLPNAHTLEAALHCGSTLEGMGLFCAQYSYDGYSWYDMLPRIEAAAVFFDGIPYKDWPEGESRPTKIEIEITITQAGEATRALRLPALIHAATDDVNALDFVAVQGSPWDNEGLDGPFSVLNFLMGATFQASDDFSECDSWRTQRDSYAKDVQREINAYFRGPEATLRALLCDVIDFDANRLAKQLSIGEIRLRRTGPALLDWKVELVRQAPPGADAFISS